MPPSSRPMFSCACFSAWEATTLGAVARTNVVRKKYWRHWTTFTTLAKTDPFLNPNTVSEIERDIVTGAFASLVRQGTYEWERKIRVASGTDTLSSILKTIKLAGKSSPIYHKYSTYQLAIERMVGGYHRLDPLSVPQLAVPISLAKSSYKAGLLSKDQATTHTRFLVIVAFYFLLRVGECTRPRTVLKNGIRVPATQTKQCVVGNARFFKDGKLTPRRSSLKKLLSADIAMLKITKSEEWINGAYYNTACYRQCYVSVPKSSADGTPYPFERG